MDGLDRVRGLMKNRDFKKLGEEAEAHYKAKGMIYTKYFGWLTDYEFEYANEQLAAAKFGKTVDKLQGIPSEIIRVSTSQGRGEMGTQQITRVLPFVFELQEMIKKREEADLRFEKREKARWSGIMAEEENKAIREPDKCPICGGTDFKIVNDYKTVIWADCNVCNTRFETISGKTYKEWSDEQGK